LKKHSSRRGKRRKQAKAIKPQPQSQPAQSSAPKDHREESSAGGRQTQPIRLLRLAKTGQKKIIQGTRWLIGLIIGSLGLAATAYQLLGGPPWPTAPVLTPQPPSVASPFDNPFDVANKSGFADLYDLAITCRIVFVKASRLNVTRDFKGRLIFPARGLNPILLAGSTSQFTCPFREYLDRESLGATALDHPTEARIALLAEYKTPLWWVPDWFRAKQTTPEAIFTLDTKTVPPRWTVPLY
jgi:hypothetical protein